MSVDAVRYYAMRVRSEALARRATDAMDAEDYAQFRQLSVEANNISAAADELRKETIRQSRILTSQD